MNRREAFAAVAVALTGRPQDTQPQNFCVANTMTNWDTTPKPHEPTGITRGGFPICRWCSQPYWRPGV